MTLADVRNVLDAEVLWGPDLEVPVESVGAADMMSDVLALSRPNMLLLTGLVSSQTIRTAVVADLVAVVFVRGKTPGEDLVALARESGIPVLKTAATMFDACGRLYAALRGR
jgi:predicted transcriptional regulator